MPKRHWSSQQLDRMAEKQSLMQIYNLILEASENAGGSSEIDDILGNLYAQFQENSSTLKESISKIESQATFGKGGEYLMKRQRTNVNHVNSNFLQTNPLAIELLKNTSLESEYFRQERLRLRQKLLGPQKYPFPWSHAELSTLIRPNFDGCVICNSEEFEGIKLYCDFCDSCVHIECVGENENKLNHKMNHEKLLEVSWSCKTCSIQNEIDKTIEVDGTLLELEFKPECCLCKLPGSILYPTNYSDQNANRPPLAPSGKKQEKNRSFQILPTATNSEIVTKETYYQKCLAREKKKGKPVDSYAPTLVSWMHLSCAFWLPQINFERGKPIHYRPSSFFQQNQAPCQICHSKEGLLLQCNYDASVYDGSVWDQFVDFRQHSRTCNNVVHVECARRADFKMTYSPSTEKFEAYCHQHGPYQTDEDRYLQFWEKVDSVNAFVKEYQALVKANFELFRFHDAREQNDLEPWPKNQLRQLSLAVEKQYFQMPAIQQALKNKMSESAHSRFIDYKVTLNRSRFDWSLIADQLQTSVEDCYYQYSSYLANTKDQFKKEVLSKNNVANYKAIEELTGTINTNTRRDEPGEGIQQLRKSNRVALKATPANQYQILQSSAKKRKVKEQSKNLSGIPSYKHVAQPELNGKTVLFKELSTTFQRSTVSSVNVDPQLCCYCACTLDQLKNRNKGSLYMKRSESILSLSTSDRDEVQKAQLQQLNSISGFVKCGRREDCVKILPDFHFECCLEYDKTFSEIKKAHRQWICMFCLEHDNAIQQNRLTHKVSEISPLPREEQKSKSDQEMSEENQIDQSDEESSYDSQAGRIHQDQLNHQRELSSSRQPAAPASGFATSQAQRAFNPDRTLSAGSKHETKFPSKVSKKPYLIRIPFEHVEQELLDEMFDDN